MKDIAYCARALPFHPGAVKNFLLEGKSGLLSPALSSKGGEGEDAGVVAMRRCSPSPSLPKGLWLAQCLSISEHFPAATLSGLNGSGTYTQGSSFLATLGFEAKSLWDFQATSWISYSHRGLPGRTRLTCWSHRGSPGRTRHGCWRHRGSPGRTRATTGGLYRAGVANPISP